MIRPAQVRIASETAQSKYCAEIFWPKLPRAELSCGERFSKAPEARYTVTQPVRAGNAHTANSQRRRCDTWPVGGVQLPCFGETI